MGEIDLTGVVWRKSSRSSGNGQCVEVAFVGERTAMRDSKNLSGAALTFAPGEWRGFVDGVRNAVFDR